MLPSVHRLSAKAFPLVLQKGTRIHTDTVDVRYTKTAHPSHIGFVVGKSVDKRASRRNRMKRQLSETVRQMLKDRDPRVDAVFIVRKPLPQDHGRVARLVQDVVAAIESRV